MIEHISAPEDPRLEAYAKVGSPRWLQERGLFVAEGRLLLQRLIETRLFAIRSVLVSPAALRALEPILVSSVRIYVADQAVVNTITGFNFHRGCLAIAERPSPLPLSSLVGARRLLALEGVGNPDNVGGLFRVAAAFGAGGMLLDPATGDPFYRKAIRTSMAAALTVPFVRIDPWLDGLLALRAQGYSIVALTPRTDAQPLAMFVQRPPERIVLLVGAEGPGLRPETMAAADVLVRIPLAPGVDSLNVAVAAGIALSRLAHP